MRPLQDIAAVMPNVAGVHKKGVCTMSKGRPFGIAGGHFLCGQRPAVQCPKMLYPEQESRLHKLVLYNTRNPRRGNAKGGLLFPQPGGDAAFK